MWSARLQDQLGYLCSAARAILLCYFLFAAILGILDQNTGEASEKQIDVFRPVQHKAQSSLHNYVRASIEERSSGIPAQLSAPPLKESTTPSVRARYYLSQWFLRGKYICPLMSRTMVATLAVVIRPCEGSRSLLCRLSTKNGNFLLTLDFLMAVLEEQSIFGGQWNHKSVFYASRSSRPTRVHVGLLAQCLIAQKEENNSCYHACRWIFAGSR